MMDADTGETRKVKVKMRSQLQHLSKAFRQIHQSLETAQENTKRDLLEEQKKLDEVIQKSSIATLIDNSNNSNINTKTQTFMEFSMNGCVIGKLYFSLFDAEVPLTAENFRQLCNHKNVRV